MTDRSPEQENEDPGESPSPLLDAAVETWPDSATAWRERGRIRLALGSRTMDTDDFAAVNAYWQVDEIFRFIDDAQSQDRCNACDAREQCPLHGDCAFMPMWNRVQSAIYDVYDQTTIQDLLNHDGELKSIGAQMPTQWTCTFS